MKQETIDKLLELANVAFAEKAAPDKYARASAHKAAFAAAYKHCPESADAAALLAATDFICATTNAANFSAHIADIANHNFAHDSYYHAAIKSFEDNVVPMKAVTETLFLPRVKIADGAVNQLNTEIASSYTSLFTHLGVLWKN